MPQLQSHAWHEELLVGSHPVGTSILLVMSCARRRGTHNIAVRRRYLNLFRGIIPPLGGTIDLSPILAFITLDVRNVCMQPPRQCCVLLSARTWQMDKASRLSRTLKNAGHIP